MVCHTCCEFVEKFYKYRMKVVANDKLLKERCGQIYCPPVTDKDELENIGAKILGYELVVSNGVSELLAALIQKEELENRIVTRPVLKHESVVKLINEYPNLKFPKEIHNCDINPVISVDNNEIKNWYDECVKQCEEKLLQQKVRIRRIGNIETTSNKNEESNNEKKSISDSDVPNNVFFNSAITTELMDSLEECVQNIVTSAKKPAENISCSDTFSAVNIETQINAVSTTTREPNISKKKRKLRKKMLNKSKSDNKRPNIELNHNGYFACDKAETPISNSNTDISKEEPDPISIVTQIFVCRICFKLYNTAKKLRIHQSQHLSCMFCKLKIPSLRRLRFHENICGNPPKLQLTRVDEVSSITCKYPNAFDNAKSVQKVDVPDNLLDNKVQSNSLKVNPKPNIQQSNIEDLLEPSKSQPIPKITQTDNIDATFQAPQNCTIANVPANAKNIFTDAELVDILTTYLPNGTLQDFGTGPANYNPNPDKQVGELKQSQCDTSKQQPVNTNKILQDTSVAQFNNCLGPEATLSTTMQTNSKFATTEWLQLQAMRNLPDISITPIVPPSTTFIPASGDISNYLTTENENKSSNDNVSNTLNYSTSGFITSGANQASSFTTYFNNGFNSNIRPSTSSIPSNLNNPNFLHSNTINSTLMSDANQYPMCSLSRLKNMFQLHELANGLQANTSPQFSPDYTYFYNPANISQYGNVPQQQTSRSYKGFSSVPGLTTIGPHNVPKTQLQSSPQDGKGQYKSAFTSNPNRSMSSGFHFMHDRLYQSDFNLHSPYGSTSNQSYANYQYSASEYVQSLNQQNISQTTNVLNCSSTLTETNYFDPSDYLTNSVNQNLSYITSNGSFTNSTTTVNASVEVSPTYQRPSKPYLRIRDVWELC